MNYGLTDIFTLLGALSLFLYGMKVMSDALMALAGNRMRNILATTTSNRFFAVITGFIITAIIQSSSATTLMVISFTNAGLLTLTESIGVIMGANIGTTVTAWLISILGFKVKMSALALPLLGFGFLLSLSKKANRQHWGYFTIGFCLLFIGLQFLQDSVPDIRNNPEALAFLSEYTSKGFLSVLLFLLFGTILTLVVQSSSATMALTLLMCFEGWIPFDMAAAMVLGQNVGTTITANIAALVANYQAKRAAIAHLLFNLLGVIWGLILFYPILHAMEWLMLQMGEDSPFLATATIPVALSLFHTCFNIANTLMLIGFVDWIREIVEKVVPVVADKATEIDEPHFLSESSLKFPQTAIKALFDESLRLLETTAYQAIAHGLHVHRKDLESGKKLKHILKSPDTIPLDLDRLYDTKIKTIYSCILSYATRLQSQFTLEQEKIEIIRNILIADRMLVQVVKQMNSLHDNIEHYMASDNLSIRREYNILRRHILKIIRSIHHIATAEQAETHIEKQALQKLKAEELDVLLSGRLDKLVLEGEISNDMATSLMNDSAAALRISQKLVDITTLLYTPEDALSKQIDEHSELEALEPVAVESATPDEKTPKQPPAEPAGV
ncbi:Na/Pi cotransporter family protein [Candidatus Venteria ishoeyi]|uniref:Na+/Pi-cotransporter n=1 Tax=Candidatus Venteria ishoeyi TaxID=1899563 RepID=A0A1H6FC79_9GAMM|nr:Na/Pi symporter [Candidatus Venteria ishoeyi]MDM8545999.1 Na/Pi symporter [Candidatus Venteria ishoeyi]SEH06756.1 Na+/Pi-cotransporter [Candidatus Venteria ishoeyi]